MPKYLHLVDGTFELFRAHYARRPDHIAPDGQPAKAAIGVVTTLLRLLQSAGQPATHVAAAFDNPIESFRNDLFPGYKSGEGIDPDIRSQFDLVEEGVAALGVVVWSMDKWEADDALATAAIRWRDQCEQVRIMTPDKDLGQVVDGVRIIQVDTIRRREIDEAAVRERRVAPESIPDFLALNGDSADGIPGLPGFGEKTSKTLLDAYGHIEEIPGDPADWRVKVRGAEGLAGTLRARREDALLYRRLATLVTDVPLTESLTDLEWRGANRDALAAWCKRVGSPELAAMPRRWRPAQPRS
ncbi:MAG: flap endonuclease [Chloroflexi bacterium]|nr:flap endonuclease [Chloroflexota bacterium]MCI0816672.1 flap endonuclease [Chloroflexota bacterium]MCI0820618.1 flap endonuclease [Chloroflexota bacterium]MCI0884247.1 flap endonuclease [Chloroflexota bacterium]MCI0885920.1 flap endonuclease [Chloroflexota bacterium]